jgi:hypothetical protein
MSDTEALTKYLELRQAYENNGIRYSFVAEEGFGPAPDEVHQGGYQVLGLATTRAHEDPIACMYMVLNTSSPDTNFSGQVFFR